VVVGAVAQEKGPIRGLPFSHVAGVHFIFVPLYAQEKATSALKEFTIAAPVLMLAG
jgi:hypothetical protein